MRLLSYSQEDERSFGALVEGRIVDLHKELPEFDTLRDLLAADALVRALDTAAEVSPGHRLEKVRLLPPVTNPGSLLCVFDESRDNVISIDPKFVRGTAQRLPVPPGEAKPVAAGITFVLAPPSELGEIRFSGVTLCVYLSPGVLAIGPYLVTTDELERISSFELTVRAAEHEVQFVLEDLDTLARRLATEQRLMAGDEVAILRFLAEVEVSDGDTVEAECEPIGTLVATIETEQVDD